MILTLPDPTIPDLNIVLSAPDGRDDIASARNAAATLREQCGESDLSRLLDRLAGIAEWAQADPTRKNSPGFPGHIRQTE